ncbi:MAG: hypothetical protein HY698_01630 [Deltaproteobacteria bacterium]|nr:hypothetical protein [Deltaproteobacteria bacterium]
MSKLIEHDPIGEAEAILREQFYGRGRRLSPEPVAPKEKPTHYKIVCISLYNEDIARLEELVAELKRRGHTKANKSAVIRFALDSVDISKMPKGY